MRKSSVTQFKINNGCQRGVAIIMVLLIVAIATALAVYISMQQNLWQRQVESQFERAQARQLGLAGIDWARAVLAEDARGANVDHEKEIWTLRLPAIPVESGEVIGSIEDRQGLFNLNNLEATNMHQFQSLLVTRGLNVDLAAILVDWMDTGDQPEPGGAEDGYYLALPQAYRAANLKLVELGDLIKVKGFDSRTIESLRAFVSVLPDRGTPVNVNFAPPEVLAALINGLSVADARVLEQRRKNQPFQNIPSFNQVLQQMGVQPVGSGFTVESEFFYVTGTAIVGNSQVVTQVLLRRGSARPWPTIVWQSVQ